ncbi:MAG: N-6 DNA methylase, partial [Clostridia bacterium]|nr:N-6 DNA methylase [Clostridia bacterium]
NRKNCATPLWLRRQAEILLNFEAASVCAVTPRSVRALIAVLAAQRKAREITDICCGTFSLGIQVWNEMGSNPEIACFGEEMNSYLCAFSRLFLFLCDIPRFSVSEQNIMNVFKAENDEKKEARVYVADFPLIGSRTIPTPPEIRFISDDAKSSIYADWFMIQQTLERMNDADRAFLLVTKGALVRKNEYFLRKHLIENDWLDAVIHIPSGIYPQHNLPMELLVCEKKRNSKRREKVLFAELGSFAERDSQRICKLSDEGIIRIADLYRQFRGEGRWAKTVDAESIRKNAYSLYPPIYLTGYRRSDEKLKLGEVAEVIRGLQNVSDLPSHGQRYLLNVRNIQNGVIRYEGADEIEVRKSEWEQKYRIREDDLIITCKGAVLKIAVVPPDPPPAYISGNLTIIRVKPDKYPPYLLYEYLISERGRQALELIQTGTTIRVLGSRNLEQLTVERYDNGFAAEIGAGLKAVFIEYRQSLSEAEKTYKSRKEKILNQIKEKEGV